MPDRNAYSAPRADLEPPAAKDTSRAVVEGRLRPQTRLVLLAGLHGLFLLWFAYDGWITTGPEMLNHQVFNRTMTLVMLPFVAVPGLLAAHVARAVRERQSNAAALLLLSPRGDRISVATTPWLWSLYFAGLNLIPHRRPWIGVLCFLGSSFSFGLVPLGLAFFARRLIRDEYEAAGWIAI